VTLSDDEGYIRVT